VSEDSEVCISKLYAECRPAIRQNPAQSRLRRLRRSSAKTGHTSRGFAESACVVSGRRAKGSGIGSARSSSPRHSPEKEITIKLYSSEFHEN
jgi:hypothetical protein